jgi:hypothetical protein
VSGWDPMVRKKDISVGCVYFKRFLQSLDFLSEIKWKKRFSKKKG